MKKEKKQEKKGKEIRVLDSGINTAGTRNGCCGGSFLPLRA